MMTSELSESEECKNTMGDASRAAPQEQEFDKQDKTIGTRAAGLTQDQPRAAKVHAAGSTHPGETKVKNKLSRDSTTRQRRDRCHAIFSLVQNYFYFCMQKALPRY
jgi:hypothetical protein